MRPLMLCLAQPIDRAVAQYRVTPGRERSPSLEAGQGLPDFSRSLVLHFLAVLSGKAGCHAPRYAANGRQQVLERTLAPFRGFLGVGRNAGKTVGLGGPIAGGGECHLVGPTSPGARTRVILLCSSRAGV